MENGFGFGWEGKEGGSFRSDRETVGFLGIVGQEVALEEAWVMLSVLVLQTGEGVNDVRKGACANHVSTMANFLKVRLSQALPGPCRVQYSRFLSTGELEGSWSREQGHD